MPTQDHLVHFVETCACGTVYENCGCDKMRRSIRIVTSSCDHCRGQATRRTQRIRPMNEAPLDKRKMVFSHGSAYFTGFRTREEAQAARTAFLSLSAFCGGRGYTRSDIVAKTDGTFAFSAHKDR